MAAIAATDVTHTDQGGTVVRLQPRGGTQRLQALAFADGVLTYPTGGVPLSLGKLGCPTEVLDLVVVARTPTTANPLWLWNGSRTAPKLVGYEINAAGAADEQLIELDNTDTPVAQAITIQVNGY